MSRKRLSVSLEWIEAGGRVRKVRRGGSGREDGELQKRQGGGEKAAAGARRRERGQAGWKQEGLISWRRGPLIAAELRGRGDGRDKGERSAEEREGVRDRKGVRSLECHPLFRPVLLVSSRLPFRLALFGPPAVVFEFTSRRNLYENLTMLARAASVAPAFQVLLSLASPSLTSPSPTPSRTHTRAHVQSGGKRLQPSRKARRRRRLARALSRTCDLRYELYSLWKFHPLAHMYSHRKCPLSMPQRRAINDG